MNKKTRKTLGRIFDVIIGLLAITHLIDGIFYEGTVPAWELGVWMGLCLFMSLSSDRIIKNYKELTNELLEDSRRLYSLIHESKKSKDNPVQSDSK